MRAGAVLAIVAAVAGACRGGSAPGARLAEVPLQPPLVVPRSPEAGAAIVAAEQGMPELAIVLADPRLAAVLERMQANDSAGAAKALEAAWAATTLDAVQACTWSYEAGRLHADAGEATEAAASFERAMGGEDGGPPCALAPYAALHAAEAMLRVGRQDDAIHRLQAIGDDFAAREAAKLALADAFVMKGDRAAALPVWRGLLATWPHGVRWVDTSLRLAGALLDGVDKAADPNAQEALDLTTRVLVEAPMTAEKLDVLGPRARAAKLLHVAVPNLTPDERARQAQAWLDTNQPKRATEVADALLKAIARGDKKNREPACKAAIVRAQAVAHGKSDALADAWGDAIARCDGQDAQVTALYYGGKASASAHRFADAMGRFELVEKRFGGHRLADDARFREALVVYDEGDEAKYLTMMAGVADAYPDGDMKTEALFRVAFARMAKRDLDEARTTFDRLVSMTADDRGWGSSGRAAYYRARVAELSGASDDAKSRYAALVADQPLGFYMLLAYARLHAIDEAAARAAVQTAVAREPKGPFLTGPHAEFALPAFERFKRLLEVGDVDAARREASAGGLVAESVDPEVSWTIAWLYDKAGAPDLGHSFARSRLVDYRAHWPTGRWRLAWQVAFPQPWDGIVRTESAAAGIPPALTWAIMREESAFNPEAHSAANAFGLMQLIAGTARLVARGTPALVDEASLYRPEVSIALGAKLLGQLRSSFSTNPSLAIAAYNSGSGAVRRWLGERGGDDFDLFVERIPFDETRNYLKRVLGSEAAYAYLYAPEQFDELVAFPRRASGQDMIAAP